MTKNSLYWLPCLLLTPVGIFFTVQQVQAEPPPAHESTAPIPKITVLQPVRAKDGTILMEEISPGKPNYTHPIAETPKHTGPIVDHSLLPASTPRIPIPAAASSKMELEEVKTSTPSRPVPGYPGRTVEMQELRPAMTIEVTASKTRTFRTRSKITRVAVSDPSIAEAIVVSEREFVLMGKRDGAISLILWFEPTK